MPEKESIKYSDDKPIEIGPAKIAIKKSIATTTAKDSTVSFSNLFVGQRT